MAGEYDVVLPCETRRIAGAIAGARLVIVPGADHVLLLDDVARGKDEGGDDDGRDEDIEETHNALHSVRTDGPLSV